MAAKKKTSKNAKGKGGAKSSEYWVKNTTTMDITIPELNCRIPAGKTINIYTAPYATKEGVDQSLKSGELGKRQNELKQLKKVSGPSKTPVVSRKTITKENTFPSRSNSGAIVIEPMFADDVPYLGTDEYFQDDGREYENSVEVTDDGTVVVQQNDVKSDKEVTDKIVESMKQAQKTRVEKSKTKAVVVKPNG